MDSQKNREQHVVVNGVASSSIPVISGVPQGSVLGPLLFLIYIDGISLLKFSDDSKLSLYADDMLLYKVISSNADYIHLQHDIDRIQNWSSNNLMSFNVSKCKCMLISRKPHMNYIPIPNTEWKIPGNCQVPQIPGPPRSFHPISAGRLTLTQYVSKSGSFGFTTQTVLSQHQLMHIDQAKKVCYS